MVRKVNYNNPIMQEYIKRGQHIQTSNNGYSFVTVRHSAGNLHVPHTTRVVYEGDDSSSSSMTTAEKIAAGIQIGSAGIKAAAEIIEAIGDVQAKKAANGTTTSTSDDKPVYQSSSTVSDSKESVKNAKASSKSVTSAIKEYKKTGDKASLEDAVKNAKVDVESNKGSIEKLQSEVGSYKADYDKAEKDYNTFHDGEYATAVKNKKETESTYNETKKKNDTEISNYKTKVSGLNQDITNLNGDIAALNEKLQRDVSALDSESEDYQTQKARIEAEINQQIQAKKSEIEQKQNEIKEIQGDDGNGGKIGELIADTQDKQDKRDAAIKAFNEADSTDKANKATRDSAKDDYKRVERDNNKEIKKFESANKTLNNAIKDGNKALGSYAV